MKKYLILLVSLTYVHGFSQQVIMKRTVTQFFFLCLANGNSLTNTCGGENFSTNYSNYWIAHDTNAASFSFSTPSSINIANEMVGSNIFNWLNPGSQYIVSGPFVPNPLSFLIKSVWADCNSDGNKDALLLIIDFPFSQTNGLPIPVGTTIRFNSPSLTSLTSGNEILSACSRLFSWDGENWNMILFDPSNPNVTPLIVDINWQTITLKNNNFDTSNKLIIFPNPSTNYIIIQKTMSLVDNFYFKIIDLMGRVIVSGNSNFDEQINIDCLSNGNYIMQIETENGKKLIEKLVKN